VANSALASAILRVCHSIMGNLYMIVSDSAKYCNSHLNFGFIIILNFRAKTIKI
jgi:hypothetical protein